MRLSGLGASCLLAGLLAVLIFVSVVLDAEVGGFITSTYSSSATGWKPDTLDYGIGIMAFADSPGNGPVGRRDTIVAYEKPQQSAQVLGYFLYHEKKHNYTYAVAGRSKMQPNILEFAYEECGVPFDSILEDNEWARAVLGFGNTGGTIAGWVRLDPARVRYRRWIDELPKHPLFFRSGVTPEFFDSEDGKILEWEVSAKPPFNYIMHPVAVKPPWMLVRVARPADICVGNEVRSDTLNAWIRLLRQNGRPLVWYYTRGC